MNNGKTFFETEVGKAFAGFTLPGFDVDGLLTAQRKNFEAFTQANEVAVEGIRALVKRQVEIASGALEEASAAIKELTGPGGAEEKLAKNAELTKTAYEKALAATRELAELCTKTSDEAFSVLNRRFTESFEEFKDFAQKRATR